MSLIHVVINRAGQCVGASADRELAVQVGAQYQAALPHAGPYVVRPVPLDEPDIPVVKHGFPLVLHGTRLLVLPSNVPQRCFVDVPAGTTGRLIVSLKRTAGAPEDRDRRALVVPSSRSTVGNLALSLTTPDGKPIEGRDEAEPTRSVPAQAGRWYAWACWLGADACPVQLSVVTVG